MQIIRITNTSQKPTNVVLTELKPDKKKRSLQKKLEGLLSQVLKTKLIKGDEWYEVGFRM